MALSFLKIAVQWITKTPERAISQAYKAAVNIKKLENDYFNGKEITENAGYSENTYSLFRKQLTSYLRTIDVRLVEYKVSASIPYLLPDTDTAIIQKPLERVDLSTDLNIASNKSKPTVLQQLAFIDFMLMRYRVQPQRATEPSAEIVQLLDIDKLGSGNNSGDRNHKFTLFTPDSGAKIKPSKIIPIEKSIIPGSFLRAFDRISRNLSSSYTAYEQDVVGELRQSRKRTNAAIKYVVILVFCTVVTQTGAKNIIYSPLVDRWHQEEVISMNFSPEFEEEALSKFRIIKEKLEFKKLAGIVQLSAPEVEENLRDEALNIIKSYKQESLEGVKNLFADLTASLVFYLLIIAGKNQLRLVKEFIDETNYSLSDNAKAFILIATTDIFVGYHSSDGWDALLSSLLRHFGMPENRLFILTFIALVPVFLDALFKFWIFQYLNRNSPSTAVIYREMNE